MSERPDNLPPLYGPRTSMTSGRSSELPAYALEDETSPGLEPGSPPTAPSDTAITPAVPRQNVSLPQEPKEFSWEMRNYWSKPWAKLTVLADPRLSRDIPVFVEGGTISGSVKLNLRSKDAIKSVFVFVRSDLVTSGDPMERLNFFRLHKYLWSTSMGDPRAPQSGSSVEWNEKLQGEYEWPFSIKIPEFTTDSADGEQYRLPHSFFEQSSRGSIDYYLGLWVRRGKLSPDDRMVVRFQYFTMGQPARPSLSRQLAYQNNTGIPGPYTDPEGWHSLEPVQIRGTVFGERKVDVKCTVFLAKPLCYTRSTSIPCAMTIETPDAQAADLFASIKSSAVYLQQSVQCSFEGSSSYIRACGQATWWPSSEAALPHQRHIMGEVHLSKHLHPSSAIKLFRVEYAIVLFPPDAVAFVPESSGPLITQPVDIVTRFALGVRPRLASPPAYESGPVVDRCYQSLVSPSSSGFGIRASWSGGLGNIKFEKGGRQPRVGDREGV